MFKGIPKFNLNDNVKNLKNILAHTIIDDNNCISSKEFLEQHLNLSLHYFNLIIEEKGLENIFKNFIDTFLKDASVQCIDLFKEMILNTIYMHDIGKISPQFQNHIGNIKFKSIVEESDVPGEYNHAGLSSVIYFDFYLKKIFKIENIRDIDKEKLLNIMVINSNIIMSHHIGFINLQDFYLKLIDKIETVLDYEDIIINLNYELSELTYYKKKVKYIKSTSPFKNFEFEIYIYSKFLYSLLQGADFYSSDEFFTGQKINDLGIINSIDDYFNKFKENNTYKNIIEYKNKTEKPLKDINDLRCAMFIESEQNLLSNIHSNIFYEEAPTGSGKTFSSLNLILNMIKENQDLNKVFIVAPFNTLIEQNKEVFDEIFGSELENNMVVVNSTTPISESTRQDNCKIIDYNKSLLNRQFIHYPFVLTSHVRLFSFLFETSREGCFPLFQLANSVVVLDEIQSYKNSIWKEIIMFLDKYSKLLNIKIIIMSATLPKLDMLLENNLGFVDLISNRDKYFNNSIFKDRVELDFSLLGKENVCKEIIKIIELNLDKKILIEFIKKDSAVAFYNNLIEIFKDNNIDTEVLLLTGDDNKFERKRIINKVKKSSKVILVATQLVENGVNIDMNIGIKNISLLDAEEQFLGRINRNAGYKNRKGKVYFFDLDRTYFIYKGDRRNDESFTLLNEDMRDILKNKNFKEYYRQILNILNSLGQSKNTKTSIDKFLSDVLSLNYTEVKKKMQLIDNIQQVDIFINRNIVKSDGTILKGKEVWNKYKECLQDKYYARKKINLSKISEDMDYFRYSLFLEKVNFNYNDLINNIYYIEDEGQYIKNGKLNRDAFKNTWVFI